MSSTVKRRAQNIRARVAEARRAKQLARLQAEARRSEQILELRALREALPKRRRRRLKRKLKKS